MSRSKFALAILLPVLFLLLLATAVVAQGEVPPPYAGMKNPFPWSDAGAQAAGKQLYQKSCVGCHGVKGDGIPAASFSVPDFPGKLEGEADFFFWVLSEGRLAKGMPPFKSSFSEEERWQILTFIRSLGAEAPPPETPSLAPSPEGLSLRLDVPQQAATGKPVRISATLRDRDGKAIAGAGIKFFLKVDFFASGLGEIDDAVTDGQGVAAITYTPKATGDIPIVARYQPDTGGTIEATSTARLTDELEIFYQTEAGLPDGPPVPAVVLGPESWLAPTELGFAPRPVFRIPGGLAFFPFMGYLGLVIAVWGLYIRVMYQVLRMPIAREISEINTRLLPMIGMTIMVSLITLLVFILVKGPFSHPHLHPL